MRNRSLILLTIALACGLIASLGVTRALSKWNSAGASHTLETVPIAVAAQDIPMGDPISPEFVRLEPWPKPKIPRGAITDVQNVVGRRPKTRIYANTPILENQLLGKGESAVDPTEHIPPGYRVVSVQVDEVIGAGRLIRPGDRVDVLVFIQRNPVRGIPETVTRTILQDVKVFAVGDQFDLQTVEKKSAITARSISLLVTPRQAEIFMLATELGSIRLSLRSHADGALRNYPAQVPGISGLLRWILRRHLLRRWQWLCPPLPPGESPALLPPRLILLLPHRGWFGLLRVAGCER
jgi:pilus assembly protein CpaB